MTKKAFYFLSALFFVLGFGIIASLIISSPYSKEVTDKIISVTFASCTVIAAMVYALRAKLTQKALIFLLVSVIIYCITLITNIPVTC